MDSGFRSLIKENLEYHDNFVLESTPSGKLRGNYIDERRIANRQAQAG
jgi:hypothetical protein